MTTWAPESHKRVSKASGPKRGDRGKATALVLYIAMCATTVSGPLPRNHADPIAARYTHFYQAIGQLRFQLF